MADQSRMCVAFGLAAGTLVSSAAMWSTAHAAQVDEIIITAQKRAEKLQEAPIAVTALNKDALEARGIVNTADLAGIAPNLTVDRSTSGASDMSISMRGLAGVDPGLMSNDSPVATYIDGVVQARLSSILLDLVDLERVEVLRGPQGTLYGRNTTGGAVNFITRRPQDEFGFTQKFGYGTYNRFMSRTALDTGKIGDTGLKANIALLYDKQNGFYDNVLRPRDGDPGAFENKAVRGEIMFDRGGAFKASYSLYYVNEDAAGLGAWLAVIGSKLQAALVPGSYVIGGGRRETISQNAARNTVSELYLHNLTMEWSVSDALTIKAITGYRHFTDATGTDLDGNCCIVANFFPGAVPGGTDLFSATSIRQQEQFSQELQLVGEWTSRFKYVIGGFYFTENGSERNRQRLFVAGPIPPFIPAGQGVGNAGQFSYNAEADSWAVFGQGTYTPPILGDRLSATLGLRYTEDTKTLERLTGVVPLVPVTGFGHQSFNNLSYAATLDYKVTSDVLTYVRYSTGYKAGGFNPRSAPVAGKVPSYDEENIEAYEVGLKAEWFNRRLQTNVAAFYNIYRNLQISSFVAGSGGAATLVNNAGKAHYQGIELELIAVPIDGLTLNVSAGYVDPQYDKYITTSASGLTEDVSRNADFPKTSEVTASAGIQYDSKPIAWIGGGKFMGRLDVLVQSAQAFHPSPVFSNGERVNAFTDIVRGDARTRVNGRVALQEIPLGGTGATFEVALWGKNILDEAYIVQGIDFGSLDFGEVSYGEPRSGGLEVTFRY